MHLPYLPGSFDRTDERSTIREQADRQKISAVQYLQSIACCRGLKYRVPCPFNTCVYKCAIGKGVP